MEQERTAENLSSIKLKPCPFCGYTAVKVMRRLDYANGKMRRAEIFAYCPDVPDESGKDGYGCGARSQAMIINGSAREEMLQSLELWAADLWNRRADDAEA